jgi:hypothetical protein
MRVTGMNGSISVPLSPKWVLSQREKRILQEFLGLGSNWPFKFDHENKFEPEKNDARGLRGERTDLSNLRS